MVDFITLLPALLIKLLCLLSLLFQESAKEGNSPVSQGSTLIRSHVNTQTKERALALE